MQTIVIYLTQFAWQAPTLAAYAVGIIVALVHWNRCPSRAMPAFLAMVLFLGWDVSRTIWQTYLLQEASGGASRRAMGLLSGIGVLGNLVHAFAIGLLLLAVFQRSSSAVGDRGPGAKP